MSSTTPASSIDAFAQSVSPSLPRASAVGLFLLGFAVLPASAGTTWHVDAAAVPGGDGLAWTTAFDSIDSATDLALPGDQIWVKAGYYVVAKLSDPADRRSATFQVDQGVELLGGFDGTESSFDERAGLFEQTILSGDLGIPGDYADNAYHVVSAVNPPGIPGYYTTVDGFTIRDGYAVGGGGGQGGGVLMFNAALLLHNCILRDNQAIYGAGLHAQPGGAYLRWCSFIDNHARKNGGGLWGHAILYRISHCRFRGNTAQKGGGIYLHSISAASSVVIGNCLLHDNEAAKGGAVFIGGGAYTSGKAKIIGCTIAYNRAWEAGGGIFAVTSPMIPALSKVHNSVVWFNEAPEDPNLGGRQLVAFSNVQGGAYLGGANLSVDPLFVDGDGRDLRLMPGSRSNDSGSNDLIPKDFSDVDEDGDRQELVPIDLERRRRVADDPLASNPGGSDHPIVDMGAYEL